MNQIAFLVLCIGLVSGAPNAYHQQSQYVSQPDIRIESVTQAPAIVVADAPKAYAYQPAPAAPVADVPQMNYGYAPAPQPQTPSIRIESYNPAPAPVIVSDVPKATYNSYQSSPALADAPSSYGYSSSTPMKSAVPTATIVRHHLNSNNAGSYNLQVESSDGTQQSESGSLKQVGAEMGSVKQGSFSWTSPEGQRFTTNYVADERGFVAQGSHLPTPPPIPEEIRKSLETLPKLADTGSYGYSSPSAVRIETANYAPAPQPAIVVADQPKPTYFTYQPAAPATSVQIVSDQPQASYSPAPSPVLVSDAPTVSSYGYSSAPMKSALPTATIVRHHLSSNNAGSYNLQVDSSDGTHHSETGSLKQIGADIGNVKQGTFSWTSPEGQRFSTSYVADERGFVAQGAHLPTPPPIPEEIRKSLEILPKLADSSIGYSSPSVIRVESMGHSNYY